MNRPRSRPFVARLFHGLGWPIMLGLSMTVAVYYALHTGLVQSPLLVRYLAGHPIEYVETGMFFVGLAALLRKAYELASQSEFLGRVQLPAPAAEQDDPERATELLAALEELPRRFHTAWSCLRLRAALRLVERNRSADRLDEELKHLAEDAQQQASENYGLVRIIVWAIPMLGFLGTVMGITLALARLSPEALVERPTQAMEGLLGGLSIAFDTTAIALIFSIVLMFIMFLIHQSEGRLLGEVDQHVHQQLAGRFRRISGAAEPVGGALMEVARQLERALAKLAQDHAQVWQETMAGVEHHWQQSTRQATEALAGGLIQGLHESLSQHAGQLAQIHQDSQDQALQWWRELQQSLADHHQLLEKHHTEMSRQGEIMSKAVQATGEVLKLEQALNQNLKALAGAKNFEDTVISLSAAIHLLNSRIGRTPSKTQQVQLNSQQGKAA